MTLQFPPDFHKASAVAPVLIERRFRLRTRCNECGKEATSIVPMVDEPHAPATIDDFYASGVADRLRPECERCGAGSMTILEHGYVRQPTDV